MIKKLSVGNNVIRVVCAKKSFIEMEEKKYVFSEAMLKTIEMHKDFASINAFSGNISIGTENHTLIEKLDFIQTFLEDYDKNKKNSEFENIENFKNSLQNEEK